jgi:hypothetical protein
MMDIPFAPGADVVGILLQIEDQSMNLGRKYQIFSMARQKARASGVETSVSFRAAPRKEAKASTPNRAGLHLLSLLAGY